MNTNDLIKRIGGIVAILTIFITLSISTPASSSMCRPEAGALDEFREKSNQTIVFRGADRAGIDIIITMDQAGNWSLFGVGAGEAGTTICRLSHGTGGVSVGSGLMS